MKFYIFFVIFICMQVKEMMSRPHIIEKDINLVDAAKIMSQKRIGSLIFVFRNKAKGIITESDLVKNFGKHKRISSIMSKNIISIAPEETVDEALRIMNENKIKRLPVVDGNKRLVGLITLIDIAANVDKLDGEFFFN